ncbi:hypothetical protein JSY17_16355 [Pseudomonas capsici]|uniref:hypothetical protein n=1 Tax=Pseudomonas capsici TaxID=2810614 RepID=UPI0019D2D966|nr:hypothetical protein [Pseudomonas capsici]MBN6715568.1 hypothetical protein [Pseudomonas capsici]MBN6720715.1 hypothetical protein [Pseudomonas capsici]MBN6725557.1 hypothetical protein [Pseudomonas capsici]
MERQYTSPTLGDVAQYAVAACGVMPRKARNRDDETEFDQGMAKTYQKKMQRLAKEDCNLQEAFEDIAQLLTASLERYIRCPFWAEQVRDLLNELYGSYASMVKRMGTMMTKRDTTRFFLTSYAVDVAVRSLAHNWVVLQGYIYAAPQPMEPCWYLPSNVEGELSTPLDKVLGWAYGACGLTLATFHDPIGVVGDTTKLKQNERAVRSWKNGKHLPSLPALVSILEDSFQALSSIGKPVGQRLQDGIITCATIARITTFISKDIQEQLGTKYLQDLLGQARLYCGWMTPEINTYMDSLNQEVDARLAEHFAAGLANEKVRLEAFERVELGVKMAPDFWAVFEGKRHNASELLLSHRDAEGHVSDDVVQWIESRYGSYAARVRSDSISRWSIDKPELFDLYLQKALSLRNGSDVTLEAVEALHEEMTLAGVAERLPWLMHWLKGIVCYRKEDYGSASSHYIEAFQLAKYSAGELQYSLANQYLEVMAKTNQWRRFKQGVRWANYLDIPVRWLRDKEPTEENIQNAYGILGIEAVRYARM